MGHVLWIFHAAESRLKGMAIQRCICEAFRRLTRRTLTLRPLEEARSCHPRFNASLFLFLVRIHQPFLRHRSPPTRHLSRCLLSQQHLQAQEFLPQSTQIQDHCPLDCSL